MTDFEVNDRGNITSPGKFEGEASWLPTVWEMVLNGCADREVTDEDGTLLACFALNADMLALTEFQHIHQPHELVVWENDQGFVFWSLETTARLDALEAAGQSDENGAL